MPIETPPDHRAALRLRQGLAMLVGLAAAIAAALLLADLRGAADALRAEPRHEAEVASLGDPHWLELELPRSALPDLPALREPQYPTPSDDAHVRVLVPQPRALWAGLRDPVELARDPRNPAAVLVIDPFAQWADPAAKALLLAVLLLAGFGIRRLPWGRDEVWQQGRWEDTGRSLQRPGRMAAADAQLREPRVHFIGTRFWAAFFAIATVACAIGGVFAWDDAPMEIIGTLLLLLFFDVLVATVFVGTRTRRLRWDESGIADSDWFHTRRVPWAAIASFQRINTNAAAQQSHDRDFSRPGNRTRGRMRPPSVFYWIAKAADGTELVRIPAEVEKEPAFEALRRQYSRLRPAGDAPRHDPFQFDLAEAEQDDEAPADPAARAAFIAAQAAHRREFEAMRARHGRATRWAVLAMLTPFVLAALWATWSTLSLVWFGERADGVVVEKDGGELPSLVVAYTPTPGRTLQIRSDGTGSNAAIPVGARITVFHAADDPERARLDLFLELWLWPMIAGGLLLLIGLPAWLITRSVHRPMPDPFAEAAE